MENHPIPQDVTGFKFRLIGSITVKQFLYLLGAGGIALVFYLLPIPLYIKIPFMLFSAGVGLSLAFIPIDGRPMDKMILNFLKTIPSENQYIYHKKGADMPYFSFNAPAHAPVSKVQNTSDEVNKKSLLFNQLSRAYFKSDQEEQAAVANISSLFHEGVAAGNIPVAKSAPAIPASPPPAPLVFPTPVLQAAPTAPPPPPPPPAPQAQAGGIDMPNIIQGIIVDPRGKPLPNVIVEIMDSNQTPLRTFRTNPTGSFRAATPLPNGTYTIHLEDTLKKQDFSDTAITLNGTIVQPVTIKSVDQREKLRQELFGGGA
jgi:hypothetical protein